jgi:hypothetical protein
VNVFKRRYAYQYCASYQQSIGKTVFIDGIVWLSTKPVFMKDYRSVKKLLLKGLESDHITIRTLSYVGREPFFNLAEIDSPTV